MKKVLILSIYPAPYRVELFEQISRVIDTTIFFINSSGDARAAEWFIKGKYHLLDTVEGQKKYRQSIENVDKYALVAIYDYSTKEAIELILKCKQKNISYVINSDGVMLAAHGNFIKQIIKRFLLSKACAFLASGKMAKKYFMQLGAKEDDVHIHTFSTLHSDDILHHSVEQEEKKRIREKLGLPLENKIAIAVGRFIPLKRYLELITAWKTMPQNYTLLLIGGGEEEDNYKKCIEKNHIENVIIDGFHPKDELFEYYKAADVFVHPTSYDVWGLVVNEAMACGLPIVVSDHCVAGLEIVRNGENGYLIEMGNDAEMCDRVMQICENDFVHAKMAANALETIRSYTIENMAETHIKVFKEILGVV